MCDNRLVETAGWDRELLAVELQDLCALDLDFDVTITGLEMPEIDVPDRRPESSCRQKIDSAVAAATPGTTFGSCTDMLPHKRGDAADDLLDAITGVGTTERGSGDVPVGEHALISGKSNGKAPKAKVLKLTSPKKMGAAKNAPADLRPTAAEMKGDPRDEPPTGRTVMATKSNRLSSTLVPIGLLPSQRETEALVMASCKSGRRRLGGRG